MSTDIKLGALGVFRSEPALWMGALTTILFTVYAEALLSDLSKKMAALVDHGIATLGAPQALGGFLVAVLVLIFD